MKKYALLLLTSVLAVALFAQETPVEEGDLLTAGKSAMLGVEASTGFAWDIDNKSTGLETRAGLELIFPLFPLADRGIGLSQSEFDTPAVRLALKNAAFTWWNVYQTKGGNYEQDNFNSWQARPLVLSFDTFSADVVWRNYFFRVAGSTTIMETNVATLFSIFDDVMDASDRWYIRRSSTRALYTDDRYNIQKLPILKEKIVRDFIDDDYRTAISGILGLGAEFDWISVALKIASNKNGRENNANAWLIGADVELVPMDNLKIELTGFGGFNYETNTLGPFAGRNPINFGISAEYRLSFSDRFFLTPKAGFDFAMDTESKDQEWEMGAGLLLNTRGYDFLESSRILDWDEVIPVGASLSMNIDQDIGINMMLSVFEPAGLDSLLPNFGGFIQLELANLLEKKNTSSAFGILAQFEYMLAGKFIPYIRGGYAPEFQAGNNAAITGNYLVKTAVGCYMIPIHFFSMDIRYEMDTKLLDGGGTDVGSNIISAVFTIRM